MPPKKVVDMTVREIKKMCARQKDCVKCPAWYRNSYTQGGKCQLWLEYQSWNLRRLQRKYSV